MATTRDAERLDPELRRLIGILILGAIAALLDTTVVTVAVDTLSRELDASVTMIQWVNTGYLLALGMVVPLSAWSVGRFGAKRMWMFALTLFLVGSVLSGLSWDIGSLLFFRVLQGLGGGLLFPIQQTLLVQASGGKNMGRIMAAISIPAVVVPILGPVIGGLILNSLDWRWIFFVNVPICAAGLLLGLRYVRTTPARGGRKLDVLGLALVSPALAALLYGLSEAHRPGGFGEPQVYGPLVGGVLLLAAFVVHALRTRQEPVVDLRLFRSRTFTAACLVLFLSGLSLFGAMLLLPLYFQQVRGYSALAAGLLLAPQGIGSLLTRTVVGKLTDRHGARPVVVVGVVLAALGTVLFTVTGPQTSEVLLGASLVVRGAGLGAVTVAVMAAAFQGLAREQVPHASSATRIVLQVGASFGTAVLAVILQQQLVGKSGAAGLNSAFNTAFWWSLAFTVIAIVPALMLARKPPEQAATPSAGERSPATR